MRHFSARYFFPRFAEQYHLQHPAYEIRIGAIASLTGPAGEQGKNWLHGVQLAVDELKREGVLVKLISEDDATNPAKVATAFSKLATLDRVQAIIGGTWDYLAEAAYPLAARYRIPFLTPSNPVEILSEAAQNNQWVMANGLSLTAEEEAIRSFLVFKKPKTLALVYANLPYGIAHAELLEKLTRELAIDLRWRYDFPVDAVDDSMRLAALRVQENPVDFVFIETDYNGLDLFTRELERLRLNPDILTTQHLDEAYRLSGNNARFSNCYAVYPAYDASAFDSAFQQKFASPPKVFAASGYDAMIFLGKALAAGINLSSAQASYKYDGITGQHYLPPTGRAVARSKAKIVFIHKGQLSDFSAGIAAR